MPLWHDNEKEHQMNYFAIPASVIEKIDDERTRQIAKWGRDQFEDFPPYFPLAVLMEEVGEAAQALLKGEDPLTEVIQIAAVAAAWIEALDIPPMPKQTRSTK